MVQLDWLLSGGAEEDAPYMQEFEATNVNPFGWCRNAGPEIDTSIDLVVNEHLPAALRERERSSRGEEEATSRA